MTTYPWSLEETIRNLKRGSQSPTLIQQLVEAYEKQLGNGRRPSWDQHWMNAAHMAKQMCTGQSRAVGAVFVQDKRLLVSGFNGVPAKYPHPTSCLRKDRGFKTGEALHLCPCMHAEQNGISNAARHGIELKDSTVYVTCMPCQMCMGMLANVGIKRVVYDGEYPAAETRDAIANYASIQLQQLGDLNE